MEGPAPETEQRLRRAAAEEKAFQAERNIAWIRFAIIAFNIVVYYLLVDKSLARPWLANIIVVVAGAYAIFVVAFRPYERFRIMRAALFTAVSDAALITAWLMATGEAASPFYPVWYVSLFAVAFRYDYLATMLAACLYVICDVAILAVSQDIPADVGLSREVYLIFMGLLGALLSSATMQSMRDQVEMRVRLRDQEVQRLEEVSRFKTNLLNTASHELNTPMTPIHMQVHLLANESLGPLTAGQRKAVDVLQRNTKRLANLIRDVLDVARLESGRLRLDITRTALDKVVAEAAEAFESMAARKSIQLHVKTQPLTLRADHDRLVQVVLNLIGNAVKFTPEGGRIDVESKTVDGRAQVSVRDTGLGLSKEQADRLFNPFTQVHEQSLSAGGTGLGLYICKGIVAQHGGNIRVHSDGPGLGATFTFDVPLDVAPPAAPTAVATT